MRLVVADTGPLNYLVLIDLIELLPKLFEKILVPTIVQAELLDPDAPAVVRAWAMQPPKGLDVQPISSALDDPAWRTLDAGEREALALARVLNAELVLMDDRTGVAVARAQGFAVTGTLGVLDLGARRGLIDLAGAFVRLKATTFRYRPEIMDALLARQMMDDDLRQCGKARFWYPEAGTAKAFGGSPAPRNTAVRCSQPAALPFVGCAEVSRA